MTAFEKFVQVLFPKTGVPMVARRKHVRQILKNVGRLEEVL